VLLTRPPLKYIHVNTPVFPFDLHVLSTPPAFVLSQDQTLILKSCFSRFWLEASPINWCCISFEMRCQYNWHTNLKLVHILPCTIIYGLFHLRNLKCSHFHTDYFVVKFFAYSAKYVCFAMYNMAFPLFNFQGPFFFRSHCRFDSLVSLSCHLLLVNTFINFFQNFI
jgi:hypothetical protein